MICEGDFCLINEGVLYDARTWWFWLLWCNDNRCCVNSIDRTLVEGFSVLLTYYSRWEYVEHSELPNTDPNKKAILLAHVCYSRALRNNRKPFVQCEKKACANLLTIYNFKPINIEEKNSTFFFPWSTYSASCVFFDTGSYYGYYHMFYNGYNFIYCI